MDGFFFLRKLPAVEFFSLSTEGKHFFISPQPGKERNGESQERNGIASGTGKKLVEISLATTVNMSYQTRLVLVKLSLKQFFSGTTSIESRLYLRSLYYVRMQTVFFFGGGGRYKGMSKTHEEIRCGGEAFKMERGGECE